MRLALLCLLVILVAGCVSIPTNTTTPPKNTTPSTPPVTPHVTPPVTPAPEPPAVQPTPAPEPEPECVLNADCGPLAGCINGECRNLNDAFVNQQRIAADVPRCSNKDITVRVTNMATYAEGMFPIHITVKQGGTVLAELDEGKWQEGDSVVGYTIPLLNNYNTAQDLNTDLQDGFWKFTDKCDSISCKTATSGTNKSICYVAA